MIALFNESYIKKNNYLSFLFGLHAKGGQVRQMILSH